MAIKSNIVVDQGTDFSTTVQIKDDNGVAVNISGYSANAAIRKTYFSSNATVFTTAVDGNNGIITLTLAANSSANLSAGRYVYDLQTTDPLGKKSRVVEGIVTITPSVVR
jgi:hypothetical protein